MIKVFLGGTCGDSKWRDSLMPLLKINYFNPVVEDWTEKCQAEEIKQRVECNYCLYVLTPRTSSTYSIAEVVDDSNKQPQKTILCILEKDVDARYNKQQLKHMLQVARLVRENGARYFNSLEGCADFLNNIFDKDEMTELKYFKI